MVMLEEDVVDVVDDDDITVVAQIESADSEEVELVEEPEPPAPDPTISLPKPVIPDTPDQEDLTMLHSPTPPLLNMPVTCNSCSSRFEVASGNASVNCPVCDERIVL